MKTTTFFVLINAVKSKKIIKKGYIMYDITTENVKIELWDEDSKTYRVYIKNYFGESKVLEVKEDALDKLLFGTFWLAVNHGNPNVKEVVNV